LEIEREVLGVSLHTRERRPVVRASSGTWWCPFCGHSNQVATVRDCGGCQAALSETGAGSAGEAQYHATSTVTSTEPIPDDIADALKAGAPLRPKRKSSRAKT